MSGATGEPVAEQCPGHKLQQPSQLLHLHAPSLPVTPANPPIQMLTSAPLLDQPFPESGLGLGEPRAPLPETPKLITMVAVALQKSGAATQTPRSRTCCSLAACQALEQ